MCTQADHDELRANPVRFRLELIEHRFEYRGERRIFVAHCPHCDAELARVLEVS